MSCRTSPGYALTPLLAAALLAACERPPMETEQTGYRGVAMELVVNPRLRDDEMALHRVPEPIPAASADGPRAADIYQNVEVLGNLSVAQFARLMSAITAWVSPEQGCGYCHVGGNFADDGVYTKVVARRMLQMTQAVNGEWQAHVGATGVTCYTCHRGNNWPQYVWYQDPGQTRVRGWTGTFTGQNIGAASVAYSSLPYEPFSGYFAGDGESVLIQGNTALPTGNPKLTMDAERTYALMMHFSASLGANCTYCHNSRAFGNWEQSTPQRLLALHGTRMVRVLNNDYVVPLTDTVPDQRHGLRGDIGKIGCSTCHQGVVKPLYGESMLADYPSLAGPGEGQTSAPDTVAPSLADAAVKPAE